MVVPVDEPEALSHRLEPGRFRRQPSCRGVRAADDQRELPEAGSVNPYFRMIASKLHSAP